MVTIVQYASGSCVAALVCVLSLSGSSATQVAGKRNHVPAAESDKRVIRHEVVIDAPLSEVWNAWTTEEGLKRWTGYSSKIELRVGGAFEWVMLPENPRGLRGTEGCQILTYLPERLFSFSWNATPTMTELRKQGARAHVVIELDEIATDRVKLSLSMLGFGKSEEWEHFHDSFERGWQFFLGKLKNQLEQSD